MNHSSAWSLLEDFLDGALVAKQRWAIAEHLEGCPICLQRVADEARLRGQVYEQLIAVEPPSGLTSRLRTVIAEEAPAPSRLSVTWPPSIVAQVAAVLAPALVAVWLLIQVTTPLSSVAADPNAQLAVSHALFAHDEKLLDVAGDGKTIADWFHKSVGIDVSAPELTGFELAGARLVVIDGKPTAQIVYESPDHVYISLMRFDAQSSILDRLGKSDGIVIQRYGNVPIATWATDRGRMALIGQLPDQELTALAKKLSGK
jgi:anti-sigma factor RsiW